MDNANAKGMVEKAALDESWRIFTGERNSEEYTLEQVQKIVTGAIILRIIYEIVRPNNGNSSNVSSK